MKKIEAETALDRDVIEDAILEMQAYGLVPMPEASRYSLTPRGRVEFEKSLVADASGQTDFFPAFDVLDPSFRAGELRGVTQF